MSVNEKARAATRGGLNTGDLSVESRAEGPGKSLITSSFVAFFAVTVLAIADLVSDWRSETSVRHIVLEAGIAVAGLVGMIAVAQHLRRAIAAARDAQAEAAELSQRLQRSQAEAERWRADAADALRSVRAAIDEQFARWGLTVTEQEVALLLLKGLSHKEVAGIRNTSDATARQHATAIYRKSGLSGRNDLAAFFLEDLLVPPAAGAAPAPLLAGL